MPTCSTSAELFTAVHCALQLVVELSTTVLKSIWQPVSGDPFLSSEQQAAATALDKSYALYLLLKALKPRLQQ